MNRWILIVLAIHCCCVGLAIADDYLLRVDAVGFAKRPKSDKASKDAILCRIETIVRPGAVFHSKARIGTQTFVVHGELHPAEDGGFKVTIRYTDTTERTIPTESGGVERVLDKSAGSTTVTVPLGGHVLRCGMHTKGIETTQAGETSFESKHEYVLYLTEYTDSWTDAE